MDLFARSMSLFDLYMEVGEIKRSPAEVDGCVFIEVWVASSWRSGKRAECRSSKRRPLYGILDRIQKLIGDREACVLFMCDDGSDDAVGWGMALALLWHHLKKTAKYAVVFTGQTKEQMDAPESADRYRTQEDAQLARAFFEQADAIVTERSNFYGEEPLTVHARSRRIALLLDGFMEKA